MTIQNHKARKDAKAIKRHPAPKVVQPKEPKMVTMNLRVPLALRREIKLSATKEDITMVQLLTKAFTTYKKGKQ